MTRNASGRSEAEVPNVSDNSGETGSATATITEAKLRRARFWIRCGSVVICLEGIRILLWSAIATLLLVRLRLTVISWAYCVSLINIVACAQFYVAIKRQNAHKVIPYIVVKMIEVTLVVVTTVALGLWRSWLPDAVRSYHPDLSILVDEADTPIDSTIARERVQICVKGVVIKAALGTTISLVSSIFFLGAALKCMQAIAVISRRCSCLAPPHDLSDPSRVPEGNSDPKPPTYEMATAPAVSEMDEIDLTEPPPYDEAIKSMAQRTRTDGTDD